MRKPFKIEVMTTWPGYSGRTWPRGESDFRGVTKSQFFYIASYISGIVWSLYMYGLCLILIIAIWVRHYHDSHLADVASEDSWRCQSQYVDSWIGWKRMKLVLQFTGTYRNILPGHRVDRNYGGGGGDCCSLELQQGLNGMTIFPLPRACLQAELHTSLKPLFCL